MTTKEYYKKYYEENKYRILFNRREYMRKYCLEWYHANKRLVARQRRMRNLIKFEKKLGLYDPKDYE